MRLLGFFSSSREYLDFICSFLGLEDYLKFLVCAAPTRYAYLW